MKRSTPQSLWISYVVTGSTALLVAVASGCAIPAQRVTPPAAPQDSVQEVRRREIENDRERREAYVRAEPLMNSPIPAPAAFHTDRPAYTVARDSILTVVVTYVNRMSDTAYLPSWSGPGLERNVEPRHWLLQLWTGDHWVWAHTRGWLPEMPPPIRIPPGGMFTHILRVPAGTLVRAHHSPRPTTTNPAALSGTYRLLYTVYRGWTDDPGNEPPTAPLKESVSNTFTVTIQ